MTKAEKNRMDKRINKAYGLHCSGITIRVLDIGKVFQVGRDSVAAGDDDATLGAKLRDYAQSIATNTN